MRVIKWLGIIIVALGLFSVGTFLIANKVVGKQDTYKPQSEKIEEEMDSLEKGQENVLSANSEQNVFNNTSNTNVYMMHLELAALTGNTTLDNNGEPLTDEYRIEKIKDIKDVIQNTKTYDIEPKKQLKKAYKLANELEVQNDAKQDDEKLKELLDIMRQMDKQYNQEDHF